MKKKKITDNLSLKIMSVAVAVVVWLIVVNIDNPVGTNYYTITNVELINKEYVESSDTIGKMCMPEENQDTVRVAITADKKTRDKIRVSDISAGGRSAAGRKPGHQSGDGSDHSDLFSIGNRSRRHQGDTAESECQSG